MGLRIQNNVEAFNTHRQLTATSAAASKSMEKLSSGYRINRAADDAAGLAISEKMRGQIGGLAQAQRNAQDGISLVQTAEGSLTEVHSMLQRVRDLKVQYSNGTLSSDDQDAIAAEVLQLGKEIHNISSQTKFNNTALLGANTFSFQVGANDTETIATTAVSLLGTPGADTDGDGVYETGETAAGGVYDVLNALFTNVTTGPGTQRTIAAIKLQLSGVAANTDGDWADGGDTPPLSLSKIDTAIKNVSSKRSDL